MKYNRDQLQPDGKNLTEFEFLIANFQTYIAVLAGFLRNYQKFDELSVFAIPYNKSCISLLLVFFDYLDTRTLLNQNISLIFS